MVWAISAASSREEGVAQERKGYARDRVMRKNKLGDGLKEEHGEEAEVNSWTEGSRGKGRKGAFYGH